MPYENQSPAQPPEQFFIVGGDLDGVSIPLMEDVTQIGFAESCDVVLIGERDDTAQVLLRRRGAGRYEITSECGPVWIGGRSLKPGKLREMRDGASLKLGDVEMVLARSTAKAEHIVRAHRQGWVRRSWAAALLVAIGTTAVVGIAGANRMIPAVPSSVPEGLAVARSAVSPTVAAYLLRAQLDEAGLDRISTSADRLSYTVIVRGRLRPSELSAWTDVRRWFDGEFGEDLQVDARFEEASESVVLPFAVEAIWMGDDPRLTLHDGSHRWAGDELPGGWLLEKISVDEVKISKNGETLAVPL